MVSDPPGYRSLFARLKRLNVDVVNIEQSVYGGVAGKDLGLLKEYSHGEDFSIVGVNHRTVQVETQELVAGIGREALKYIEPERLSLNTDCGFGRRSIQRVHAFYKLRPPVAGARILRRQIAGNM